MRHLSASPAETTILTTEHGDFLIGTQNDESLLMEDSQTGGLVGMGGDDTLTGGTGDDELFGDYVAFYGTGDVKEVDPSVTGNDQIFGGDGDDTIWGGPGDDLLYGGTGRDVFVYTDAVPVVSGISGGADDDTIEFSYKFWDGFATGITLQSLTLNAAVSVERLVAGGTIFGTSTANQFDLSGISEYNFTAKGFGLSFLGRFDLREGDDSFIGSGQSESVFAGAGNDTLYGGDAGDILRGGTGDDVLYGGLGGDTLVVDEAWSGNDRFYGGEGEDSLWIGEAVPNTLQMAVFHRLILDAAASVEVVLVRRPFAGTLGDDLFNMSGVTTYFSNDGDHGTISLRSGNDQFIGGSGSEYVFGGAGNDTLNGGGGDDDLNGGAGNDALFGGDGDDRITIDLEDFGADRMFGGAGSDTLYLSGFDGAAQFHEVTTNRLILNAKAGIETFATEANINGTEGNDFFDLSGVTNYYFGSETTGGPSNTGRFSLGSGDDTFTGGIADEIAFGMIGRDLLSGGEGNDLLDGGSGNDTLQGQGGNDVLNGSTGADSMLGGSGNDRYFVDSAQDVVVEQAGKGRDTVTTSLATYALGAEIENLITTNTGGFTGIGNGLDNVLTGNKGADTLTGGGGADRFVFNAALGKTDILTDFQPGQDVMALDSLVFKGLSGKLTAAQFQIIGAGGNPVDTTDRILYETATGKVYFDSDGSGAKAAVLFATVTAGTHLEVSDFVLF